MVSSHELLETKRSALLYLTWTLLDRYASKGKSISKVAAWPALFILMDKPHTYA